MTVHEAGAQLYGWFSNNDCYDPEKDFNKLVLLTESEEQDKAAIECALESLEEVVIVKKKTIKDKDYWVLNKKFASVEQSVNISASTALSIYDHVQMYIEVLGLENSYDCDVQNLSEKDILILLEIISTMSKK